MEEWDSNEHRGLEIGNETYKLGGVDCGVRIDGGGRGRGGGGGGG